jgi:excisionase family DNA binding protein
VLDGRQRRTRRSILVAVPVAPDPFFAALMAGVDAPTVADLVDRPAFMADALCREHPEVDFFPERGVTLEPARRICARCLVRVDCLDYAMRTVERDGVRVRVRVVSTGSRPIRAVWMNSRRCSHLGELARILRVDPKTVSRWCRTGRLPAVKTLGGHRRIPLAAVLALMREMGFDDQAAQDAVRAVR